MKTSKFEDLIKEKQIAELQSKKATLKPELEDAFQAKNNALRIYNELNFKWMDVRDQFEELDREEKLLFFSMPKNQTKPAKKIPKDRVKEAQENAKKTAMKALESLPEAIRKRIMNNFK